MILRTTALERSLDKRILTFMCFSLQTLTQRSQPTFLGRRMGGSIGSCRTGLIISCCLLLLAIFRLMSLSTFQPLGLVLDKEHERATKRLKPGQTRALANTRTYTIHCHQNP